EHGADDHLPQIGPMILAVAILPDALAAVTFEVERCGIEEDDVHVGEQIATAREQQFLDQIFGATWYELGRTLLLLVGQMMSEPSHGPIQMVQLQLVHALENVVLFPAFGGTIAAGSQQAVQDSHEHGAFDGKFKMPSAQHFADDGGAADLMP